MGRKLGGGSCAPFGEGELGPHLTQCGQGRGLPKCQVSSWSVQPFGHSAQTSQTGQTDNGPLAQGEPFYKRSPKKINSRTGLETRNGMSVVGHGNNTR